MTDQDLLRCPLLQGLDAMHRAELLGWLNTSSNLRSKMEDCLAGRPADRSAADQPVESTKRDFEKDVHSWNPQKLIFSRSPKE